MNYDILDTTTTIVAPATAEGGAVMVVRLSGNQAIEIADKLFISKRTVDKHRANILEKTGCRNTANLVVYAIKNRLVEI